MGFRKWYIGTRSAEGNAQFAIDLDENELKVILRFVEAQENGPDEGYAGEFGIIANKSFDTEEQAKKYLSTHKWYEM